MHLSTGLPKLDHVLRGLMAGDNIVWQIDSISEYLPFVQAYAGHAHEIRHDLIYFRFADHEQLRGIPRDLLDVIGVIQVVIVVVANIGEGHIRGQVEAARGCRPNPVRRRSSRRRGGHGSVGCGGRRCCDKPCEKQASPSRIRQIAHWCFRKGAGQYLSLCRARL